MKGHKAMTEMQQPTFAQGFNPNQPDAPEATGSGQQDYFGFGATEIFTFPDGVSFIEFRSMNEGEKKNYQDKTSQDLVLERNSGNARMKMNAGTERHELIKTCAVSWNLTRGGKPLPTDLKANQGKVALGDFLTLADPKLVEDLEKAIRKANPWLLQDMKVEDIDREIANLEEMRAEAVKREAGEAS